MDDRLGHGDPDLSLLAAVAQFEDEHGAFTADELADADRWAAQATERASYTGTTSPRQRSA